MKKWIMPLTIVLVVIAAFAYATERENFSVGTLTVDTILNTAGSSYTGLTAGDARYLQLSGGAMTGAPKQRAGRAAVFPNLSTPGGFYGNTAGTHTGNVVAPTSVTVGGKAFAPHSSATVGWILKK